MKDVSMALPVVTCLSASEQHQLITQWFQEYELPLYRHILRLVGEREEAADILQDTFLRAWRALATHPPPENPFAWLYRIAVNLSYNVLRRQRRLRWFQLSRYEAAPRFEDDVATSESMRACLAQLSRKEAEVLLLHNYVGLTPTEIGHLTGDKPGTVRVRLYRASVRFGALYQQENR
ncbi:MAG: RNA polymerase sigma factor [Herpetosiphonaceae bacterium]|nr:RNA polymerase sigma factor [Herpetosiphonaceae bacterium]